MEYRTLGRTGERISLLGMGGLFVSHVSGLQREAAYAAVHRALELGVNYVDTAPTYADSEEVLGLAMEGVEQPYIISTKLGGRPQPFDPKDKDALRFSFEESLRLLKRDRVDILMIHEPDRPGQWDWWTDYDGFHAPAAELLQELKAEGLIRYTGLGGTTVYQIVPIMATGAYDVVLTAFNYSLLWREATIAVLPEAKRQGMGVIIGSPLQQGALSRRYDAVVESGPAWLSPPRREQFRALYRLLDDVGMTITDVALRWVIGNPDISTTLMGARSVEEVEANVRAVEAGPLPAEVVEALDRIAAQVPFRPFEEPFALPWGGGYRGPGWAS